MEPNGEKNDAVGTQEPSLRDHLDAAFAEHAGDEVQDTGASESAAPPSTDRGDGRDAAGRFARAAAAQADGKAAVQADGKAAVQADGKVEGPAQPPAPAPAPAQGPLKAPASWTPAAREKWSSLDPEVQADVSRREREHLAFLQQTAHQRQFIDAFENTMRPYEMFIRAEGSTPLQAVQYMMNTAAQLRTANGPQIANIVAELIEQYGTGRFGAQFIEMLDQTMEHRIKNGLAVGGNQAQPPWQGNQAQPPQQFRDPRVDMILQQQALQEQQELAGALEAFAADPAHEFFGDVRETMADLIELAARRGQLLTVPDAYEQACKLVPEVSTILAQRAAAAQAGATTQAAIRAKRAAASIKGDATLGEPGATVPKNQSLRADLEAAFDQHMSA